MAKITKVEVVQNPSSAEFYTLTALQKGDKIAFLPLDWGGVVAESENSRQYLQVLPIVVLSTTGATFISRISANTFTARAVEPVEGESYPQLQQSVSKKIAYCGASAIEELAKGCKFVEVAETYAIKCAYRKKTGTYDWTTIGLELSDDSYTLKDDSIVIDDEVISKAQIQARLKEYAEKHSASLGLAQQTE